MAGISRRELLRATGGAGLWMALGLGGASGLARSAFASETGSPPAAGRPYNILFLLTDQERHFDRWPMPVPGRERLRKMGVEFSNHQIASNACTSSRSVIYTGQSMQRTKMFDNVNSPWVGDLSTEIPTLGDMLREAGYDTAYNGSWHLAKRFEEATDAMEEYGFSDSVGVGDIVGQASGGYHHDEIITAMAVRWLRSKGRTMARDSRPWLLAVNLINPHDVMYVNTDEPGTPVQDTGQLALPIAQPPDSAIYRADWDAPLSGSRRQRFDDPGRPAAHREYQRARGWLVGNWPDEDRRWRKVQDYYYNCIRDSDRHFERILRELDDLGLTESTIIVWTSDHGELAGAHGMHGVGACAYEEQNHVPLVIAHPEVPGGMKCGALTSHLDLAPTLVGLTGIGSEKAGRITADLKGHDLTPLLADPAGAAADAVRPAGALFSYNRWLYQDADFVERHVAAGNGAKIRPPDFTKRGAIRSVFDGRYRLTRYFSPKRHNLPRNLEELVRDNDLELFDRKRDPGELQNLAVDPKASGDLLLTMNHKLNALLDHEVGVDDGSMLPFDRNVGSRRPFDWKADKLDI